MRACQWEPSHEIAEDAHPIRKYCSDACRQAAWRARHLLRMSILDRFEEYAKTSEEAARILAQMKELGVTQ